MYKVMIVDDEILAVENLIRMIDWESAGFKITGTAKNGEQALKLLRNEQVDLIFVDMNMPVMNGLELIERLSKIQPPIQYVVLSSFDEFDYVRDALKNKAFDYLLKHRMNAKLLLGLLEKIRKEIEGSRIPDSDLTLREEMRLINALESSDPTGLPSLISEIFLRQEKNGAPPGSAAHQIAGLANRFGDQYGVSPEKRPLQPAFESDDHREELTAYCRRMLDLVNSGRSADWKKLSPRIRTAVHFILANYGDDIKLTELAEFLGLDHSYFSRLFKAELGKTFSKYLNDLRIEKAIRLMEQGSTVKDAAAAVGYITYNNFFRVFRERMHCTPVEYLKSQK